MRRLTAPIVRTTAIAAALLLAIPASPAAVQTRSATPTDEAAIVHALNRLTFGATVEDVQRVKQAGLDDWIDRQLDPSRLADAELEARLAGFDTLELSSSAIAAEYAGPARRERKEAQRRQGEQGEPEPGRPMAKPSAAQTKGREVLMELSEAKLLRAIYSERQLDEVLVDFWFNHFNVFAGKGQTRVYITEYEREAIRPHVLGRFRDLLEATARSPAMLFYLDNWLNSAPAEALPLARARRPLPSGAPPRRARGLNENYARELLELHTLGVDGGYTQTDIVNVARAFTGWTIDRRDENNVFRFVPALHDAGEKRVLGQTIRAGGGEQDGERVLDIVAAHPSTARFIAAKLARRFVSDQPPPALIDRAAARFTETSGDLRAVVRVIITSPEFYAADVRAAKVKTPLELVASALRATGAHVENAAPLIRVLRDLGMPAYLCQPPTGYGDTADSWVSSGALVSRMNFAMDLTHGKLRGITAPSISGGSADPAIARDEARKALLLNASDTTLATMVKAETAEQTWALAIGSPEFQRR